MHRMKQEDYATLSDRLFDVLFEEPATSVWAIARRLGVTSSQADKVIAYVRKNAEELGWSIPHVARGMRERKFFPVLIDRGGKLDASSVSGENTRHLKQGFIGTLKTISQMGDNEVIAARGYVDQMRIGAVKRKLSECLDDFAYLSRRVRRILPDIDDIAV